jgi:hypothetical protein
MKKVRSIFVSMFFGTAVIVLLSDCSGKKRSDDKAMSHDHAAMQDDSATDEEVSKPQFEVDAKFQEQLAGVFTAYITLKDAFVSSDASKVKTEAKQTKDALANVDMKLVSGAAHNDWMNYLSPIQSSLNEMEASSDIEAQRKSFSTLSDNLYKSVKAFGLGGKEAFYEYCPMAFNNEGGYWLSDEDQIRNPYFGDKMLTCGSVVETLK